MLMVDMTRIISELLHADEPLFGLTIEHLEAASGRTSEDVRLTSEILAKAHQRIRHLGLDPKDTTGPELYGALLNLVALHDQFLTQRIGGRDVEDVADLLPRIQRIVEKVGINKTAWVLKHSVAKRLLKNHPPKKVMKILGCRSVDSMLKRENIAEVFGALRFAESADWMRVFLKQYHQLTPHDFESRQIEFVQLDAEKWGAATTEFVHKKRHNITHLKELGVILLLPMPFTRMRGVTITVLPLLLHYINEIRLYSSFFKHQQVQKDFGKIVADTLFADPGKHAVMAGQHVHWRVIQRYFGKLENEQHPEIFEPHVQPEDLHWRKAEEVLYRLEPALQFWQGMDFVGLLFPEGPVSFSLMDVAVSYVNDAPYEHRAVYHMRESLWNELFIRYMGQSTLERQVLKQLDNDVIEPELLSVNGI
jgi:hypothetical protein